MQRRSYPPTSLLWLQACYLIMVSGGLLGCVRGRSSSLEADWIPASPTSDLVNAASTGRRVNNAGDGASAELRALVASIDNDDLALLRHDKRCSGRTRPRAMAEATIAPLGENAQFRCMSSGNVRDRPIEDRCLLMDQLQLPACYARPLEHLPIEDPQSNR